MIVSDTEENGFISKMIGDKRRWRAYKARVRRLPEDYRTAVEAFQRYFMYFGAVDGDSAASMLEDLADLFEQAAADRTPIHEVVGEDPVEFAEAFAQNYRKGGYVDRERKRLTDAIESIERGEANRLQPRASRGLRSTCRGWRSHTRNCTFCAVWTSTWRGAASSRCSAPTGQARPRS